MVAAPAQAHRQPREHAPLPQRHQLHAVVSRRRPAARGRHLRPPDLAREHPLRHLPQAVQLAPATRAQPRRGRPMLGVNVGRSRSPSCNTRSTPSRSSCPRCSTAPRPTMPSTTTARARTSVTPSPCSTSFLHSAIPACAECTTFAERTLHAEQQQSSGNRGIVEGLLVVAPCHNHISNTRRPRSAP